MAENKKSVLLYCDIIHTVEKLKDDEAGRLFKHYLRYINDIDPEAPDTLTELLFESIKQNLKRDLIKWQEIKEKRIEAGAKGGKQKVANASFAKKNVAKLAVNVNDNVTVNVTDTVNDNVINKKKIKDVAVPLDYKICLDFWIKEFKPDFTFGGQQGKALKSILKKIEKLRKNTDVSIFDSFKIICQRLPEWYKDKDLPVIDSKLNEIILQIKNGSPGKQTVSKGQHTINVFTELIAEAGNR